MLRPGKRIEEDGKVRAAPVCHAARPARENRRGFLRRGVRRFREDEGQLRRLHRIHVDEGRRQLRHVVREPNAGFLKDERAFVRNIEPERFVRRILADGLDVADEFNRDLIAGIERLGVQGHRKLRGRADHFLREIDGLLQDAVHEEIELRDLRQNGSGNRKCQVERRTGNNLVGAHAEVEELRAREPREPHRSRLSSGHKSDQRSLFNAASGNVRAPHRLRGFLSLRGGRSGS